MDILSLLLGWLLGLLGSPISERIKRYYQKNDVRCGIISELNEIKVRLAMMVYQLTMKVGTFDKQLLEWEKKQLEGYKGDDQTIKNVLLGLEKFSGQTDDKQLATVQLLTLNKERPYSLKKFYLPFLESRIDSLAIFGEKFRRLIFETRSKIQLLNDEVDNAQFYYRKTFDSSMSRENHEIVRQNLESCHKNINNQAKLIVEKINDLISCEN